MSPGFVGSQLVVTFAVTVLDSHLCSVAPPSAPQHKGSRGRSYAFLHPTRTGPICAGARSSLRTESCSNRETSSRRSLAIRDCVRIRAAQRRLVMEGNRMSLARNGFRNQQPQSDSAAEILLEMGGGFVRGGSGGGGGAAAQNRRLKSSEVAAGRR